MTINQETVMPKSRHPERLLAAGGLLGALAASSCCVLPLALFSLGVSGVKAGPEAVPGVSRVSVSYEAKTATVTYDDSKTGVKALTGATTNAGYPSNPKT